MVNSRPFDELTMINPFQVSNDYYEYCTASDSWQPNSLEQAAADDYELQNAKISLYGKPFWDISIAMIVALVLWVQYLRVPPE